jgi:hypothetical protein
VCVPPDVPTRPGPGLQVPRRGDGRGDGARRGEGQGGQEAQARGRAAQDLQEHVFCQEHVLLPPSLPYKVDTSRPSLRTKWTRLVPFPQVKRAIKGDKGVFRATFEDKVLASDIVFLRTWVQVCHFTSPHPTPSLGDGDDAPPCKRSEDGWTVAPPAGPSPCGAARLGAPAALLQPGHDAPRAARRGGEPRLASDEDSWRDPPRKVTLHQPPPPPPLLPLPLPPPVL